MKTLVFPFSHERKLNLLGTQKKKNPSFSFYLEKKGGDMFAQGEKLHDKTTSSFYVFLITRLQLKKIPNRPRRKLLLVYITKKL